MKQACINAEQVNTVRVKVLKNNKSSLLGALEPKMGLARFAFANRTLRGTAARAFAKNMPQAYFIYAHAQGFKSLKITKAPYWELWSRRWDLNPQPTDYKSVALPIELLRRTVGRLWCLGAESNHRHRDFQSLALPTELPRQNYGDPEGT